MSATIVSGSQFSGYYAVQICPTCGRVQGRFDPRGGSAGTTSATIKTEHQRVSPPCDIRPRKSAAILIYDAATQRLVGKTSTSARFGDVYRTILAPDAQAHYGIDLRRAQESTMRTNGQSMLIADPQPAVAAEAAPMHSVRVVETPTLASSGVLWQDADGRWWAQVGAIEASPFQPADRDKGSLLPLVRSLEQFHQLQPIDIRQLTPDRLRVMEGHRRLAAARYLGWDRIKVALHSDIQTDEQELRFIQEVNTQRVAYGGAQVLQSLQASGWDFARFCQSSNPKMQRALGRWLLRFPDAADAVRMMHLFGTPAAIYAATILVRYVDGPRSHREEARKVQYAREAEMLRWMALDQGKGLGLMQRTALMGHPTAKSILRAMKTDKPYSVLVGRQ